MKRYLQPILLVPIVAIVLFACAKKINYDTFDTSQYVQDTQQYGYLTNSLNTLNTVVVNATVSATAVTALSNDSLAIGVNTTATVASAVSTTVAADATLVAAYNSANGTSYVLLPAAAFSLSNGTLSISSGTAVSTSSAVLKFNKSALALGSKYLLPVKISSISGINASTNENVVYVIVNVPAANTATAAKASGYKQILYVEINDNNPLNAGSYYLTNSKIPLFDVVNIFAANINYDDVRKKPVIYFNQQLNAILTNRDKYIAPLQKKGIKVCLALLGNHQGVGFDNFTSQAAMTDFAMQAKKIVDDYQLDGIDIDDEYAQYGTNNQAAVNDSSLVLLTKKFREVMPDKIISYYYYSDAISIPSKSAWNGLTVGQYVDYTYQGVYGTYSIPNLSGLTDKMRIGPFSVNLLNNQNVTTLNTRATTAKTAGYGVFMWYNLQITNRVTWFTPPATVYYGEGVTYNGEAFAKDY